MKKARLLYLWVPRFFGLTPENIDTVYEQQYILIRHLKFSYTDSYKLPVYKRNWFINRLIKEKKDEKAYYNEMKNKSKKSNKF